MRSNAVRASTKRTKRSMYPRLNAKSSKDRVVTESGIAVEIDPEEAAASEEAQSPAGNAPEAGKSGENFDDIFGSFDGGEKK